MTYKLTVATDSAYEELVVEIVFENGEIFVVSQERNDSCFELSIYSRYRDSGDSNAAPLLIDLDEFAAALSEAKQKLISIAQPRI